MPIQWNQAANDGRYAFRSQPNTISGIQTFANDVVMQANLNVAGVANFTDQVGIHRTINAASIYMDRGAADFLLGSITIGRHTYSAPASIAWITGNTFFGIGQKTSGHDLEVGCDIGAGYVRLARWKDQTGSLEIGPGTALATSATGGLFGIPHCAGTPTGIPDVTSAIMYDTTANKLWVYNGSWRSVTLA